MTPCTFHNALLCRLRSPKGKWGPSRSLLHLQQSGSFSPLRKLRDPNQPHASATVQRLGGSPRLDRPVRWDRSCASVRLKVLVAGLATATNTFPPARAVQPPAPTADETARARPSVCGRPHHAPLLLAQIAQCRAMCVLDTAASCVGTWPSVLRTGGRLSSCTSLPDRTVFSIPSEQNEQSHVRSCALTVQPQRSSGSWGAHQWVAAGGSG